MFCENCGAQIQGGGKFCPKCGSRVEKNQTTFAKEEQKGQQNNVREKLMNVMSRSKKYRINIAVVLFLLIIVFITRPRYEYVYFDDGTAAITHYEGWRMYVKIPSKVRHKLKVYTVTEIGNNAFGADDGIFYYIQKIGLFSIRKVSIPDGVTKIGDDAFYNIKHMTTVSIPNSVTSIGRSAFAYCGAIIELRIPDNICYIGESALGGAKKIIFKGEELRTHVFWNKWNEQWQNTDYFQSDSK